MAKESNNLYISWVAFQRRSESVAKILNLELKYFHYDWEEKHRGLKIFSYLPKFINTLVYLFRKRPALVVVQLAPAPPLYAAAIYAKLTNTPFISDCHNTMIYDGHWIKWPFAAFLLRRSSLLLVHNEEVRQRAKAIGIDSFICLDPPPLIAVDEKIRHIAGIEIKKQAYVLLPCNMAADDEPAEEFFEAARRLPHVQFVLTGFLEKVPADKRQLAPLNVKYTGYLQESEFNALYKNAAFTIVLSTREGTQPSGASEAIALGVPLIVTDLITTRKIYKDSVVFTKNNADDLVKAINEMIQHKSVYKERIASTKENISSQTRDQYANLLKFIHALQGNNYEVGKDAKDAELVETESVGLLY